jgi:hypothetical protein
MAKVRVLNVREETTEEKELRKWFSRQALVAPDTLDAAARLVISLVTGLLTILLGVLAVAEDPLPAYLGGWAIRLLGMWCVLALLVALLCALLALWPRRIGVDAARPKDQAQAFADLLDRKAGWLKAAEIAFALGVVLLGLALIVVLFIV